MLKTLTINIFIFFFWSCSQAPVSNDWLKNWNNWEKNSPNKSYSLRIDPEMSHQQEPTLRFEIRSGDTWIGSKGSKTHRVELAPSTYPTKGSTNAYECNIFIPENFPKEDNRLVLMQWWPKTKRELGEVGRSPSLALRYVDGEIYASVRHSDQHVITDPDSVPKTTIFKSHELKKNQWNHFLFHVKWSNKNDGYSKLWWNGKQVANYHGPVGYDDPQGPIFRFGIYRDDSPNTYVVYFNQCKEKSLD